MPDGAAGVGPYANPPSSQDAAILAAIEAGRPEEIRGLAWTHPDLLSTNHKVVRRFSVDPKKRRDGSYIRCSICSTGHPKFLDGAVLWSGDGWLRLIGHVCADRHAQFGARYRSLLSRRRQEERDDAAFSWLGANICYVPVLEKVVRDVIPLAKAIEEQQAKFFREVEPLALVLETVAQRHSGALTVDEVVSSPGLSGDREGEDETGRRRQRAQVLVGAVAGAPFLTRRKKRWSRDLQGVLEALARLPEGEGDERLLALIDAGGEEAVTLAAVPIFRGLTRALQVADECAEASNFTQQYNLAGLAAWGRDQRNPTRFDVQQGPQRVTFVLEDRSRVSLPLTWPPLPDLSLLRAVVSEGIVLRSISQYRPR